MAKLSEFMTFLTASPHSRSINFAEFRDFLLLLPMRASPAEIYRYYEMRRYLGDDARGPARVTMEGATSGVPLNQWFTLPTIGDVSLSAEDRPTIHLKAETSNAQMDAGHTQGESEEEEEDLHAHEWLEGHTALRFLLAGGVAGAGECYSVPPSSTSRSFTVSRTCTAPFDRLKIFLITRPPDLGGTHITPKPTIGGAKVIASAVARIYAEGGILAFWTGNGLSVAKIMPESGE